MNNHRPVLVFSSVTKRDIPVVLTPNVRYVPVKRQASSYTVKLSEPPAPREDEDKP